MEFQEVINKRHSIREYETKQIPKSILKKLIINAGKAPSAKNEQPWNFYVITNKKKRDYLSNILHKEFNKISKKEKLSPNLIKIASKFYQNMGNAPNIIFVYSNNKEFNKIVSISCAIENLMLSATALGLGTCWIGTFKDKEKEISKLLNIPNNKELIASIIIGYPKKGYVPLKRDKKKLNEICKLI